MLYRKKRMGVLRLEITRLEKMNGKQEKMLCCACGVFY
jgi:hypothetical protein